MKHLLALAVCVLALVFAANAKALWANGGVSGGTSPHNGQTAEVALVKIHNNTTGANGSTSTGFCGCYSFTGMVAGQSYTITVSKCWSGSNGNTFWTGGYGPWTMPNFNYIVPNILIYPGNTTCS